MIVPELTRVTGSSLGEIVQYVVHAHDITVLSLDIEKVGPMRQFGAVPYRLLGDDRVKSKRAGINGSGPDTSTGCATGDDQRIHSFRDEPGGQVRSEEARGILLDQERLVRSLFEPGIHLHPLRVLHEDVQRTDLPDPQASLLETRVIGHGAENYRDAPLASCIQQPLDLLELAVELPRQG